jgi:hypothetical protein
LPDLCHGGVDETGCQGVDTDTDGGVVECRGLGETDDAVLRGDVRRHAGIGDHAGTDAVLMIAWLLPSPTAQGVDSRTSCPT